MLEYYRSILPFRRGVEELDQASRTIMHACMLSDGSGCGLKEGAHLPLSCSSAGTVYGYG
jgi:hypothetical protein